MDENLFRLYRQRAGYTQKEIAKALQVTESAVSFWENGKYQPSNENLQALADIYGVSTDMLLGRTTPLDEREVEDEVLIPVVATLRCGFGCAGVSPIARDKKPVPSSYVRRWGKNIVLYEAVGESMSPTITPGDLLVTVPGTIWENGWVVVVDVNDSDTIKRIYRAEDGGVDLIPDNNKYQPMHLSPHDMQVYNVSVLGHVVKPIGPDL